MQAGGDGLFVAPKKDHKKLTLKKYKMDRHHIRNDGGLIINDFLCLRQNDEW